MTLWPDPYQVWNDIRSIRERSHYYTLALVLHPPAPRKGVDL